jgi:hypothetical protein
VINDLLLIFSFFHDTKLSQKRKSAFSILAHHSEKEIIREREREKQRERERQTVRETERDIKRERGKERKRTR